MAAITEMTGRLSQRMNALERRNNPLAAWVHVPAAQCPDHVLLAVVSQQVGWPPGHEPADAELRAIAERGKEGTP